MGAVETADDETLSFGVAQDASPRQAKTKPTRFISVSKRGKMTLTSETAISNAAD